MSKLFTFFTILLFSSYLCISQASLNPGLIRKMYYADENEVIPVILLKKANHTLDLSSYEGLKTHITSGNLIEVSAPVKTIKLLAQLKSIQRIEYIRHNLQPMLDTCLQRNRIKPVRLGTAPLPQAYDGTGVIMGIIDTGIDFSHPDFKDALGNSRIKYLWDMTKPVAANTPTAFGYGQEWTNTDIDLGLCTHSDLVHWGHGTGSSGISAGNGLSVNHYEGMAPKADIMVVALDFNRTGFTIADGVSYLLDKAQQLAKPISINISVGDYYGSHDGTDLETQLINSLITAAPGRVLTAAAGNAGNVPFHMGYNTSAADTNFTWIKNNTTQIYFSEFADTLQFKNVHYTIGANNPAYADLGNIGFKNYSTALNTLKKDTLYHNAQRIGIIESIASINTFGVYELEFLITPDSINYLWRLEHTGNGRVDSWNFDYVTSPLPSIVQYPKISKFKKADTLQTIVSGFQCSNEVITVANYVNRNQYVDVNNNIQITTEIPGEIAGSSSIGPSRDNKVKPDIAATGATILAPMAMGLQANMIANNPQLVAQGGYHFTVGGTSSSSPVVAGLAALYLQKNPAATNQQVKQAIINCAYTDAYTAAVPNNRWGYGKLDGFGALTCGVVTTGIQQQSQMSDLIVKPNPFLSETEILFGNAEERTIKVYNVTGNLVFKEKANQVKYIFQRENLSSGLYLLSIEEKNRVQTVKLIIL